MGFENRVRRQDWDAGAGRVVALLVGVGVDREGEEVGADAAVVKQGVPFTRRAVAGDALSLSLRGDEEVEKIALGGLTRSGTSRSVLTDYASTGLTRTKSRGPLFNSNGAIRACSGRMSKCSAAARYLSDRRTRRRRRRNAMRLVNVTVLELTDQELDEAAAACSEIEPEYSARLRGLKEWRHPGESPPDDQGRRYLVLR